MAIHLPTSNNVTGTNTNAFTASGVGDTVIVRNGIFLTADGTNAHGLLLEATNINAVIDGYVASDNSNAVEFQSNSEVAVGVNGVISGSVGDGLRGLGADNEILNDGRISANGAGIDLDLGGHTVTNNGSINAGADNGIAVGAGSRISNTGSISSGLDGIYADSPDGIVNGSVIANSGSIIADFHGVSFVGADAVLTNSGDISARYDGIRGFPAQSHGLQITNTSTGSIAGDETGIDLNGGAHSISNAGSITGRSAAGIAIEGSGNTILNDGLISSAESEAIITGSELSLINRGTLSGVRGVFAEDTLGDGTGTGWGSHAITNDGDIIGTSIGVLAVGWDSRITNNGNISSGTGDGINLLGDGVITNAGEISSRDQAIYFEGATGAIKVIVANSGGVISENGFGIRVVAEDARIDNSGRVVADLDGIWADGVNGAVTNSGSISANDDGIFMSGPGSATNTGTIVAGGWGIFQASGGPDETARSVNDGVIHSETDAAIYYDFFGGASSYVANTGTLIGNAGSGSVGTVRLNSSTDASATPTAEIYNSGEIIAESGGNAVFVSGSATEFRNLGHVQGDVALSELADRFDTRGGTVSGEVRGNAGDDTYIVDDSAIRLVEAPDEGTDAVESTVNFALGDNFEILRLIGGTDQRGEGNELDNTLTGGIGDDTLAGAEGDDLLIGGIGGDALNGGTGSDTAAYTDSAGWVNVSLLTGFVGGGAGSHAIGDSFASIENVVGSGYGDRLNGDNGANRLIGGSGDDILRGRGGADDLQGGGGMDTADYEDSAGFVNVSLLTGFVGGSAGSHAIGDTFSSIENLTGSQFDDLLNGDNFDNVLQGRLGADTLDGNGGSDTASYEASAGFVNVSLLTGFAGGGSGSHAMGDTFLEIENLRGSAFDDILNGDNGANALEGGAGNDSLRGNLGADTFVFADGFGQDTVADFTDGSDLFDFSGHSGIAGFGDLTVTAAGADAVISDGAGSTITVTGAAGLIDATDFLF